jgi:hypothetical protein
MNWAIVLSVFAVWLLAGLAVAYLFGGFIRGVEAAESTDELRPPVVSYLRRNRRAKTASGAHVVLPQPKVRRKLVTRH